MNFSNLLIVVQESNQEDVISHFWQKHHNTSYLLGKIAKFLSLIDWEGYY